MSAPAVVQGGYLSGGFFDQEATKSLAKRVSVVACLGFWVYVVQLIVSIADPVTRARLKGDFNDFKDADAEDVEQLNDFISQTSRTTIIFGFLLNITIMGSIMFCGWYGSKTQNRGLISVFACCSGLCAFCAFFQVICLFAAVGIVGSLTFAAYEELDVGIIIPVINTILFFILFVVYCLGLVFSIQLYQQSAAVIMLPNANMQYQTYPVQASPVYETRQQQDPKF